MKPSQELGNPPIKIEQDTLQDSIPNAASLNHGVQYNHPQERAMDDDRSGPFGGNPSQRSDSFGSDIAGQRNLNSHVHDNSFAPAVRPQPNQLQNGPDNPPTPGPSGVNWDQLPRAGKYAAVLGNSNSPFARLLRRRYGLQPLNANTNAPPQTQSLTHGYDPNNGATPGTNTTDASDALEKKLSKRYKVIREPAIDPLSDPTIRTVVDSADTFIQSLLDALNNMVGVLDTAGSKEMKMLENNEFDNDEKEGACIAILVALIDRCIIGFTGHRKKDGAKKEDMSLDCISRLKQVINTLKVAKTACRDILFEDIKMAIIVHQPITYAKTKKMQKETNDSRRETGLTNKEKAVAYDALVMNPESLMPTVQSAESSQSANPPSAVPVPPPAPLLATPVLQAYPHPVAPVPPSDSLPESASQSVTQSSESYAHTGDPIKASPDHTPTSTAEPTNRGRKRKGPETTSEHQDSIGSPFRPAKRRQTKPTLADSARVPAPLPERHHFPMPPPPNGVQGIVQQHVPQSEDSYLSQQPNVHIDPTSVDVGAPWLLQQPILPLSDRPTQQSYLPQGVPNHNEFHAARQSCPPQVVSNAGAFSPAQEPTYPINAADMGFHSYRANEGDMNLSAHGTATQSSSEVDNGARVHDYGSIDQSFTEISALVDQITPNDAASILEEFERRFGHNQ